MFIVYCPFPQYPCRVGSLVSESVGWNGPEDYMDKKEARRQGRYTQ